MKALYHFVKDERGVSAALTALALFSIVGIASLAVDVGMLYAKRAHLQRAADIAALAGARGLMISKANTTIATDAAVSFGRANLQADDGPTTALTTADVSFYTNAAATTAFSPNQVEVSVHRGAGGSPVTMYFAKIFGIDTAEVAATARAEIVPTCRTCIAPLAIPNKFTWNDNCSTGKHSGQYNGNGALDPDSVCEMNSIAVPGYSSSDFGTQVVLKSDDPSDSVVPGWFNPVDLPPRENGSPDTGGAVFRDRLGSAAYCEANTSEYAVGPGNTLQTEPGNMVGPTQQGIAQLVASDPNAHWVDGVGVVDASGNPNPNSPRIITLALYDPRYPPTKGRSYVTVSNLASFFVEGMSGKLVTGRFVANVSGTPWGNASPGSECLTYMVRLVYDSTR